MGADWSISHGFVWRHRLKSALSNEHKTTWSSAWRCPAHHHPHPTPLHNADEACRQQVAALTCIGLAGKVLLDFLEGSINDSLSFLLCSHHRRSCCRAGPICPAGFALGLARRALLVLASLAWNLCTADNSRSLQEQNQHQLPVSTHCINLQG